MVRDGQSGRKFPSFRHGPITGRAGILQRDEVASDHVNPWKKQKNSGGLPEAEVLFVIAKWRDSGVVLELRVEIILPRKLEEALRSYEYHSNSHFRYKKMNEKMTFPAVYSVSWIRRQRAKDLDFLVNSRAAQHMFLVNFMKLVLGREEIVMHRLVYIGGVGYNVG